MSTVSWDPNTRIYTLRRGGSGQGLSYWSRWVDGDCERKIAYDEEALASNRFDDMPRAGKAAQVGTLGHALLHVWLLSNGKIDSTTVKFEPIGHPALADPAFLIKARQAFDWFQSHYRQELFRGDPWRAEHEVELLDFCGLPRYTAAFDLDLAATYAQSGWFNTQFNCDLQTGGRYLLDWKFVGVSKEELGGGFAIESYVDGLQRVAYCEAASRERPVDGFIHLFIMMTSHVVPMFKALAVQQGPPTPREKKILEHYLVRARLNKERNAGLVNPNKCYDYRGPTCRWLSRGCERI